MQAGPIVHSDRYYIWQGRLVRASLHTLLMVFSFACLIPLWLIISASFSDNHALLTKGYSLVPRDFTTVAYDYVLTRPDQILHAYGVTIYITAVGTVGGLLIMSALAYPLSRPQFRLRNQLSLMVFLTMLFNGGLVPYYILMTQYLHLRNSVWALILPGLVNPFFVLILRTYFRTLPEEVFDAGRVDGANEFQIFWRIALPMAKPALATIGVMLALSYWNEWVNVLYFIDDPNKVTLQFLLHRIQEQIRFLNENPQYVSMGIRVPEQSVRMAIAVLAVGPASILFLFFQKYLVRGMTLGSFK